MKLTDKISAIFLLAVTCMACTHSGTGIMPEDIYEGHAPLNISVNMPASKGIISDTGLPDGSSIGISLTGEGGGRYDSLPYSNIRFTASGNGNEQIWSAGTDVMLSTSKATLWAYYPFNEEVSDLSAIPVHASDDIQTDYLYSTPVSGLSNHKPDASITMKHALAAIRISLKRGSYTGTGSVSKIAVKGEGIATEASLDARSGKLTHITGAGTEVSPPIMPFTLSDRYKDQDIIIIPAATGMSMDIEVTIDDEIFSVTIPEAGIAQGRISIYEATVNNADIDLSSVKIDEWSYDKDGNPTLGADWTIRLTGDKEGISFASSTDDDGSIRIMAVPMLNDAEVMSPTVTGETTYLEEVDNETGIRTIILKDIKSDVDISYDGYNLWFTAIYEISDISSPVKIMNSANYSQKTLMDGHEIENSQTYRFEAPGKHTARIMFRRNTSDATIASYGKYNLPGSVFSGTQSLVAIMIPEGITHVNSQAFHNCRALSEVHIPKTLTSVGYYAWYGCSSITEMTFPENTRIDYSALAYCTSLTKVRLPANATRIASGLLANCTSLERIDIPAGVTSIDYNAFQSSGLTELHLPDGLSVIPDGLCQYCKRLASVRFPANLSEICRDAFASCPELSTIVHSDGTAYPGCINIPEGVTAIGMFAFYSSEKFSSIHLPSTLQSTQRASFAIKNISSVSISEGNSVFDIRGNAIIETATNTLRHGFRTSSVDKSVTTIGEYAFYNIEIPDIDFHENLKAISGNAFTTCTISRIISRSATPPAITSESFKVSYKNGTLIVPPESIEAYRNEWFKDEAGYLGYSLNKWSMRGLRDGE